MSAIVENRDLKVRSNDLAEAYERLAEREKRLRPTRRAARKVSQAV
jgi:hypothetical protein